MASKTILVVEDDSSMQRLLMYYLEKAGYEVVTAENGEEGLERMEEKKPDVVITDLMMAFKDGFELCRDIRNRRDFDSVSIIVITARDQSRDMDTLLSGGVNRVMQKPFNPKELTKAIEELTAGK